MKPILLAINAFDTRTGTSVYYTFTGSSQVVSNELTITNIATGLVEYSYEFVSYERVHHIPPNILRNGKTYSAELRVKYSDGTHSDFSNAVNFYVVSTPVLDIISVDGQGYIYNKDVTFVANYSQLEREIIKRYRFSLYNENDFLIKNYPMRYNHDGVYLESIQETITGLEKGKGYYIEVMVETEKGMYHSQKERFIPMYVTPAINGVIEAFNDKNGFVKVESRLKQLLGTSINANQYYNYKYIDGEWIVIPNEAPVLFKGLGMNRASDFVMKAWFKSVPVGEMFISLTQEDALTSIDFYRYKDRVIAKKSIDGVESVYTSNTLEAGMDDEIFMFVRVIEHRLDIFIDYNNQRGITEL